MAASSRVTYANIYSEAWNNIFNLINTRSNVADPITPSSQFRKFVYSREPDIKKSDFAGYPFIIVNPAEPNVESEGGSLDDKKNFVNWTIEIEVVASDRGSGNTEGKGLTYLDAISDDIFQTLMDKTNNESLNANGLFFPRLENGGVVPEDTVHNERVFRRSIFLSMRTRMTTSA